MKIITIVGTPQLTLETGITNAVVDYTSGSGSTTLTFDYIVASGHVSSDLGYKGITALAGTINDTSGNAATLTLPEVGSSQSLSGSKNMTSNLNSYAGSTVMKLLSLYAINTHQICFYVKVRSGWIWNQ